LFGIKKNVIFESTNTNTGTGLLNTQTMDTLFKSEIKKILTSNVEFEFSLDFQGMVEYIESDDTDQFLEYEQVLLFLVKKELIPINERTEGIVKCIPVNNEWEGIVYITYQTCLNVGEDWNDDMWESGKSERLVSTLLEE
jgi:hypothetical protein